MISVQNDEINEIELNFGVSYRITVPKGTDLEMRPLQELNF